MPSKLILATAVFFLVLSARAAPPAGADPRMAPWFGLLRTPKGGDCCGVADCREVEALSPLNSPDHKHWWAFIGKDDFGPEAPNALVLVPDKALQIDTSDLLRPPGPVACWLSKGVFYMGLFKGIICFRPPRTRG